MSDPYRLHDVVELKKPHPCLKRSKEFEIIRLGADIKIRCLGCGSEIMLSRYDFNQRVKRLVKKVEE